jgi:hypothetical protein
LPSRDRRAGRRAEPARRGHRSDLIEGARELRPLGVGISTEEHGPATFVLIPGACHGGWCFEPLAEQLRQHGHRAYALTLTGLGERDDSPWCLAVVPVFRPRVIMGAALG